MENKSTYILKLLIDLIDKFPKYSTGSGGFEPQRYLLWQSANVQGGQGTRAVFILDNMKLDIR